MWDVFRAGRTDSMDTRALGWELAPLWVKLDSDAFQDLLACLFSTGRHLVQREAPLKQV